MLQISVFASHAALLAAEEKVKNSEVWATFIYAAVDT
jgi:hypothetical protein